MAVVFSYVRFSSRRQVGNDIRTVNLLEEDGIFTVEDLLNCTPERLLRISNIGEKTLDTIYEALAKIGFHPTSRPPVEEVDGRKESLTAKP
jgi:DNA-directed RNA polymerase subunit alpha